MTSGEADARKTWDDLRSEIAQYTAELFNRHTVRPGSVSERKVIRDAVHGYFVLEPWEVEIVDSPLVQRLRYIHQTALTFQVYPSAHHTRFEHSLGAAKLVSDVASYMRQAPENSEFFDETVVEELRIGALLHDVGHCLFSHLSEVVITERFRDQFLLINSLPEFKNRAVGEILSHALLVSPTVQKFLEEVFEKHGKDDLSPKRIAGYCVGHPIPPDPEAYKADLISGPLDVDKLDYLPRDTYFTGIRSDIDVQHILRSMTVLESRGNTQIAARISSVSGLEQMHFAKAMLFPAIYHHQKVRALEASVRSVFEVIEEEPESVPSHMKFNTVSDFFRTSQHEFFALARANGRVGRMVRRILDRRLPRRALHVSQRSLVGERVLDYPQFSEFVDLSRNEPSAVVERNRLRSLIYSGIPKRLQSDPSALWIDIPPPPPLSKDILRCKVVALDGTPLDLTTVFPIRDWLTAYAENKWAAHVFYEPEIEYQSAAFEVAMSVLEEEYGLRFSDLAKRAAKVRNVASPTTC